MAARRVTLTVALKKLLFLRFALTSLLSAAERPALVVLLVDAMGLADPGCHGQAVTMQLEAAFERRLVRQNGASPPSHSGERAYTRAATALLARPVQLHDHD